MYNKIVKSNEDIIGIIAYGIYQKHKIEYCKKIITIRKKLTSEDVDNFKNTITDESIEHYTSIANKKIANFLEHIFEMKDSKTVEILRESIKNIEQQMITIDGIIVSHKKLLAEFENKELRDLIVHNKVLTEHIESLSDKIDEASKNNRVEAIILNVLANIIWIGLVSLFWFYSYAPSIKSRVIREGMKATFGIDSDSTSQNQTE